MSDELAGHGSADPTFASGDFLERPRDEVAYEVLLALIAAGKVNANPQGCSQAVQAAFTTAAALVAGPKPAEEKPPGKTRAKVRYGEMARPR